MIVNADGRVKGFDGNDWVYRKDDQRFTPASAAQRR